MLNISLVMHTLVIVVAQVSRIASMIAAAKRPVMIIASQATLFSAVGPDGIDPDAASKVCTTRAFARQFCQLSLLLVSLWCLQSMDALVAAVNAIGIPSFLRYACVVYPSPSFAYCIVVAVVWRGACWDETRHCSSARIGVRP